jgi:hypothetical protein
MAASSRPRPDTDLRRPADGHPAVVTRERAARRAIALFIIGVLVLGAVTVLLTRTHRRGQAR